MLVGRAFGFLNEDAAADPGGGSNHLGLYRRPDQVMQHESRSQACHAAVFR